VKEKRKTTSSREGGWLRGRDQPVRDSERSPVLSLKEKDANRVEVLPAVGKEIAKEGWTRRSDDVLPLLRRQRQNKALQRKSKYWLLRNIFGEKKAID